MMFFWGLSLQRPLSSTGTAASVLWANLGPSTAQRWPVVAHRPPLTLSPFPTGPQCNASVDLIGTCWPRSAVGQLVARPCPEYFYGVRYNTTSKMGSTGGDTVGKRWGNHGDMCDNTSLGTELIKALCGIHQAKSIKALVAQISKRVVSQQQLYNWSSWMKPHEWGEG